MKVAVMGAGAIGCYFGGLLARAVQHEFDHLQGILFIDRATPETRAELEDPIRRLARSIS